MVPDRDPREENRVRLQLTRIAIALSACAAIALPAVAVAGGDVDRGRGRAGGNGAARAAQSHTVVLKNIRFSPSALSIRRGESVTWLWRDGPIEHNVTASGWRSRTQSRGSFTVRFERVGTFSYRCTVHEDMKGKIVVH
jgi:plastocyanin